MPDNDKPPDNVVPFPNIIPYAVAQGLRDFYGSLLTEPLPDEIKALCGKFEERAQKAEDSQKEEPDAGVA
jgi:hypothetical protein